jgi:hypothetical protein
MTPYTSFLKKYKSCSSEAEQLSLLKDFMLNLPPDKFFAWMSEGTDIIDASLRELMKTGNPDDLQFVKTYIKDLEMGLKKETALGQAA